MEEKRWRTRQAGLTPSQRCSESGETERRGRAETHRYVTMAAASSYMSEQRYVMRKPLFSDQQHASILKKSRPPELSEKEQPVATSGRDQTKMKQISGSFKPSHSDPESRENFDSLLNISELGEQRDFEEPSSPFCAAGSVPGWSSPLRPRLTSTVLYPTYTPCSGRSRRLTEFGLESRRGRGEEQDTSYLGLSKGDGESTHQENYWACAIPRTSPPASDRRSSSWDPNRAYEALLDYSYPLRPGLGDISGFQEDSHLQDSGIGLDHVGSSTSLPGLHCSTSGGRSQRSPDLQGFRSAGGRSLPDPVASSLDSLDCSEDKGGWNHDSHAPLCSFTSTRLLPPSRCVCRELDEEFWALPDHLEVLQLLSTQVREVTAKVSQESVEPSSFPLLGSEAEREGAAEDKRQRYEGDKARTEETAGTLTAAASGEFPSKPPSAPPAADLRGPGSVEALTGPGGPELEALGQRGNWKREDQSNSLMQHIQVFCSHLKLLIQQLYALSERMQKLSAPPVDIDSVKSALADYQSFQSEVSSQQPLSDCVLHTGQLLLSCINTASPMLRDTLRLIECQSGELQSHTQLFLSSILSAMDSILQSREDAVEVLRSH